MRFLAYSALKYIAIVALLVSERGMSAGEFTELSQRLPSDANALIVVNAESLYESALGQKLNWRQKFEEFSETTSLLMPPTAQRCIFATRLDIDTLTPDWEAAVMTSSIDPSIAEIAARRGGVVDSLGGLETAWIAGKTCIVKFAPQLFGVLTPATRQEAARWVAAALSPKVEPLSPYLQQSLSYADTVGTQIILAIDLVDSLPVSMIRSAVARSELLDPLPEDEITALITGVQGIKLGVLVDEKLNGRLQIDFASDAALLAPVAKPLILAILGESGAMLDEFKDWKGEAKGKSISIAGQLTPEGLQRIMSMMTVDASAIQQETAAVAAPTPPVPPQTAPQSASPAAAPTQPTANKQAIPSQKYFRALSKYVDDAQRLNRADSLRQSVMWLQNYARGVDNLSTRNVDPELLQYGQYVSQTFRAVIDQAYGVEDKYAKIDSLSGPSEVRMGLLPTGRTVQFGPYYYEREYAPYGWATYNQQQQQQSAEQQQKIQEEIYQDVEQARQTLAQLVSDQENVRSKLSQRYGVLFR
jgi:hypothetical protein